MFSLILFVSLAIAVAASTLKQLGWMELEQDGILVRAPEVLHFRFDSRVYAAV